MKKVIVNLFIMASLAAHSGGALTLEGNLKNFDASTIEIDDGKKIYVIDKTKLPDNLLSSLKKLKPGAKTKIAVGFDAITNIRAVKK